MGAPIPSTIWTQIRRARDLRGTALDDLLQIYWKPIRNYLTNKGFSREDAEDLTQEVFAQVSGDDFLKKADADRGKFRSLLFSVTQHVATNHRRAQQTRKRGGGFERIPLEALPPVSPDDKELEEYNRFWASHLVQLILEQIRRSNPDYAMVIEQHYIRERSQKEIAEEMGRTEKDIKNAAYRGKKKFMELLPCIIEDYCVTPEEGREELEELSRHLP